MAMFNFTEDRKVQSYDVLGRKIKEIFATGSYDHPVT